ncbi:TPA: branched-chain amino acid ABC transporter substrate-binding protein [Burkholderia cenocepacia]|uniref:branched-chain amino acid ABC transporter substrate-binding protein n=1 Tax=unclassified Burkholderia TaxID=2613784 RepID=UPI00158C3833|nr:MULTISPECIES: branched-chain amino acid ABC transporter substrate-binding protein [unclassified Burkholderia]HEF5874609.1 branched-chain amino acid ABC transporter substrate-binding protein [Burkholderia cenocepacia]
MSHYTQIQTPLAAACIAAVLAFSSTDSNADDLVAKIAVAGPTTGQLASLGKDVQNSGELAIDALNAKNIMLNGKRVRFELVAADDGADPRVGTIVAQRLVDDHVVAVVGHINSGVAIPASRIYSQAGMPFISSGASNPALTAQSLKNTFRVVADDNAQARGMVQFLRRQLKAKRIGLVDDRTAYGQGLGDQVAKDAGESGIAVTREFTNDKAVDFRAILTSLKSSQPDAIVLASTDAIASPFVKQMKTLGMTRVRFVGGDGICTENWVRVAGSAAEGEYCTQTGAPLDQLPGSKEFVEKYEARFHQPPQYFGPYTYDSVMVVGEAIRKAGSLDPLKVIDALHSIDYTGVTGRIEFDSKGDQKYAAVSVYQVKSQKITSLGVIEKM